ncbi:MAG: hypothetical protein P4L84_36960 [Isosphaeraceae bacterium]|nr:hypothetical protein [Isosphaeraceae bacterium]
MIPTPPEPTRGRSFWPWVVLAGALVWGALVRVPLVLNAPVHLDSDLAVDGLTLLEAVHGHWRWHYPGTPYMGTLPVILSWPQAMLWEATPVTLVSGGAVAWLLLTVGVFALAWCAFGRDVASGALVPLAFCSTGAIWLSGRVTGGHVLTAAWHAVAFGLLYGALARGGRRWAALLGVWCGAGLWLDSMFAATLAGLVPAAIGGWLARGASRRAWRSALAFVVGFVAGSMPREAGRRMEPYDAYPAQFAMVRDRSVLVEHVRLLLRECVPRLVAGHRLPGYQSDPDARSLGGAAPLATNREATPLAIATTWAGLSLFLFSYAALAWSAVRPRDVSQGATVWGLLLSGAVVAGGFVANTNIFNADNYRYLITLLVPGAIGFGLALRWIWGRGHGGQAVVVLTVAMVALLMTADTARWYARLGWIDPRGLPIREPLEYPALEWLNGHPEVRLIYGGYWDVYRLSFLSRGRVRGKPFTIFPDRFPEWTRGLPGERPEITVISPGTGSVAYTNSAVRDGAEILMKGRGVAVMRWPVPGASKPNPRPAARPRS